MTGLDSSLVGRVLAMGLAAAGIALSVLEGLTGAGYGGMTGILLGLAVIVLAASGISGDGD